MEMTWKQKIITIWIGQSISLLTSAVLQMAIVWYITLETGSAVLLSLSTLAAFLPQALFGSFMGPLIDRVERKKVLIVSDLMIAGTSVALALVALSGSLPLWVIFCILPIRSLCTAFHEPAAHAVTPMIVPSEYITQYAGYAQAFDSVCLLMSPSLAILLYNLVPLTLIASLDAIGAVVAVCILLVVKFPPQKLVGKSEIQGNIFQETAVGVRFLRTQEGIITLMVASVLYSIIYAPVGSLYPHITMVHFGGSTTASGIVETIFSIGSLLGALVLGRVAFKLPKLQALIGSIFLYGLGVFVAGCLPTSGLYIFMVLSLFIGMTIPFYHGISRAIYQLTIPEEYLGRTFAIAQSIKRLGMPIGLLVGGVMTDQSGGSVLMLVAGAMAMVLAIGLACTPSLRRFKNV